MRNYADQNIKGVVFEEPINFDGWKGYRKVEIKYGSNIPTELQKGKTNIGESSPINSVKQASNSGSELINGYTKEEWDDFYATREVAKQYQDEKARMKAVQNASSGEMIDGYTKEEWEQFYKVRECARKALEEIGL